MAQESVTTQVEDPGPKPTPRGYRGWAIALLVSNALLVLGAVGLILSAIDGPESATDDPYSRYEAIGAGDWNVSPGIVAVGALGLALHGTVLGLTVVGLRRAKRGDLGFLRGGAITAGVAAVLQVLGAVQVEVVLQLMPVEWPDAVGETEWALAMILIVLFFAVPYQVLLAVPVLSGTSAVMLIRRCRSEAASVNSVDN